MQRAGLRIDADDSAPTVAVVITTYNDSAWLPQSIGSVLAQTHPAHEIIVVDDGSAQDPTPVIAPFPCVRLVRQGNAGLAAARNTGLGQAQSQYILFLDADDLLAPTAIASGLACFEQVPEADFVYGAHRTINGDGSTWHHRRFTPVGNKPYRDLLRGNVIGMHATVLYRCDRLLDVGGYDAGLRRCEDYDVYLRMARNGTIACHPEIVAEYRWHDHNMSRNIRAMLKAVLAVHGRQRLFAEANPMDHAAWNEGRSNWRRYYHNEMLAARSWRRLKLRNRLRQFLRDHVPRKWRTRLLRLAGRRRGVNFGDFGTTEPIDRDFGFNRGLPIDRYYIESFLQRKASDIHGRVLEIGDDSYSRRFGGANITRQDVLHVHAGNPVATIVGDLCDDELLERDAFDCMILTQTLHHIFDMKSALKNVHKALKPGGVLLLTTPGITPVARDEWGSSWYWSLTDAAAEHLIGEVFGKDNVQVEQHGNVFAATAFLQGIAVEEVPRAKLDEFDRYYPVTVAVRARKGD